MVRLDALHILIGYPPDGQLARTATGLLALTWNGGAVTIDPRTGEAVAGDAGAPIVEPERAQVGSAYVAAGASVTFASASIDVARDRVVWTRSDGAAKLARSVAREIALTWTDLVLDADDDHILLSQGNELHLLDAIAGVRRTLVVPGPIAIDDVSARGIPGVSRSRLLVSGLLVLVRLPSLLVVPVADALAALRADRVPWSVRMAMPLADAQASEPARTPSTGRGLGIGRYLTAAPPHEGRGAVRVRGRLWVPFGYERIEYEDGTSAPWHAPPAAELPAEQEVRTSPLWIERVDPALGRTLGKAWSPALAAVTEPAPTAAGAPLADIPIPTTGRAALTLARALGVDRAAGAYGPMIAATKHLRALTSRDPDDEDESRAEAYADFLVGTAWHQGTIYDGTALVVYPLVGIVIDAKAVGREAICSALGFLAVAAKTQGDEAAAATRLLLERSVRTLFAPPRGLKTLEADAWRRMLVAIGSMPDRRAAWLHRLVSCDPEIARLCAELDAGASLFDLVAAAAP